MLRPAGHPGRHFLLDEPLVLHVLQHLRAVRRAYVGPVGDVPHVLSSRRHGRQHLDAGGADFRLRGHETLRLQRVDGHVVEELVADHILRLPHEQPLVRGRPPDDAVRGQMLQRRVVGMEALALQVRHGLQVQGVVEPAEDGAVVVADYEHHLGSRQLAVHEGAEVRVELREVVDQVAVAVDDDHDPPLPAEALQSREEVHDVLEVDVPACEPRDVAAHLLDVVRLQARHAGQVHVRFVRAERAQQRGLPQVAATAYGARYRHLLIHTLQVLQLLRATHASIHSPVFHWKIIKEHVLDLGPSPRVRAGMPLGNRVGILRVRTKLRRHLNDT